MGGQKIMNVTVSNELQGMDSGNGLSRMVLSVPIPYMKKRCRD